MYRQSTSLCAIRLCEPWRRSNYIKNLIFTVDSEASLWSHWKDGCVYWCVKQVLLDQWESHQASWKINTEQLSGAETNVFLVLTSRQHIQDFTAAIIGSCLSLSKCTLTLCEQSSRINAIKKKKDLFYYRSNTNMMALLNIFICIYEKTFHQQKCHRGSWTIVHNYAKMKSNQLSFLYVIVFWSWCINWSFKRLLVTQSKIAIMLDEQ